MRKMIRGLSLASLVILLLGLFAVNTNAQTPGAEIAFEQGLSAYQESQWGKALSLFDKSIAADPNYAPAHHYRGVTLIQLMQYSEAIKSLERARDLDPDATDVHLDLGTAYLKAGRQDEAEAAFREEIRRHPDNADAYFSLGYMLVLAKRYSEASEPLARSRQLNPEYAAPARFYEATALLALDRREEARAAFQEVLEMNPPPQIADASRKYLDALKMGPARKPWGLSGSLLYQYDTNVAAVGSGTEFPIPIEEETVSGKEDHRGVVSLGGYWRFLDQKDWSAETRYSFYQSFHAEEDTFNLQNHAPELLGSRYFKIGGRDAAFTLTYTAGVALLGTDLDMYSVNHWGTPALWIKWTKVFATTFSYRFNYEDFESEAPNRDNYAHSAFVENQLSFWSDNGLLTATIGFDYEDSEEKEYDITRPWTRIICSLKLPLEITTRVLLYYEYEDHFDHDDNRVDDIFTGELLILRPVWGPIEVNANVNYRLNNSTVDAFEYERTIFGGGLVVKY